MDYKDAWSERVRELCAVIMIYNDDDNLTYTQSQKSLSHTNT